MSFTESVPTHVHDALQSHLSAPVQLTLTYDSFQAPDYATRTDTIIGRLWTYDPAACMVVLETGNKAALPPAMRRAPASAVYELGTSAPRHSQSGAALTGFKFVRALRIQRVDVLSESKYESHTPHAPAHLTTVNSVPVAALEARSSAAVRKCEERTLQLAPPSVSETGQAVFDAVNKTYVALPS